MTQITTLSTERADTDATNPPQKADGAWKRVLDRWLQPFLVCFWPDIEKQIDWKNPIEDLGQEMQSFTTESLVGHQIVDKLYKVRTRKGKPQVLLIHIEIQGDKEDNFSTRLFEYWYKIYDRHKLPVLPLVILSDSNRKWRPEPFKVDAFGYVSCQHSFLYSKLLDWKGREDSLLNSKNPFENLIAIHLRAKETQNAPSRRLKVKLEISRHLLEKSWKKDDILSFYTFLDGIMRLPKPLERKYHNEILTLERGKNVEYITSAEHFGIEKGMQQGMQKGMQTGIHQTRQEIAKTMLARGFDLLTIRELIELDNEDLASLE